MSTVDFDAPTGTWLLSTSDSSYALRLTDGDLLRHVHWGPALTLEQAASIEVGNQHAERGFEGELDGTEELAVQGGVRFGVPSLAVRFADGTSALEWEHVDHEIRSVNGTHTLNLRFADRHYPLEVTLHYRVFDDSAVVQRWTTLRNTGSGEPILLLRADSATFALPPREGYRVGGVTGQWAAETRFRATEVPIGETVFTSRRGVTSHHVNPWVTVDAGDAGEEHGEVWSAALAWSGSWRITLSRTSAGRLSVTGGFGHDGVSFRLAAGESLETPVFGGIYSAAGFGAVSRAWHAHTRAHVLAHPDEDRPVGYNSWEAIGFDVDEERERKLARIAAGVGVELFVMDDGWFGARTSDHAGLGDWTVNPERFPNGLAPLVNEVHELGMRFGLWVEPEMVNPDSDLYRAHPDWVLHFPNRTRSEMRNQLVLNFARDDVAEWAFGWLDALVGDNDIDFLKWDMNRPFTEAGWPERGDDADLLWLRYTRNVYDVLDRLRANHPGLRIEACSGGGGRVDLGMLARTDQVWISDNTDALDRLAIQHGYGRIYPPDTMSAWVTDSPNFLTGRAIPLRYRFHVAMAGVLSLGGNLVDWSEGELAEAAELVALYKDIRPVVQHGIVHWLRAPQDDGLTAMQYAARDGSRVVVFAWLQSPHFGHRAAPLRLAGLDPRARYRDEDSGAVHHGAVLLAHGLPLELPRGDYASALVRLVRW